MREFRTSGSVRGAPGDGIDGKSGATAVFPYDPQTLPIG
jgi:hypothetical protein